MWMTPPRAADDPASGTPLNLGRVSNAKLILATVPRDRIFLTLSKNSGSR